MIELTPKLRERFWSKVDRGAPDECWEWTAARRRNYGVLGVGETTVNAHRLAYMLEHETEPDDNVLHTCDNPPCCNPAHLYDGDQSENTRDWYDRQDAREKFEGESNPNAELTRADVVEIKRRLESTTVAALAEEYGVSRTTVSHISTGRNWEDVEP